MAYYAGTEGNGHLYLTDRKAHMIISDGVKIQPRSAKTSSPPTRRRPTAPSSVRPTRTSVRR